MNSASNEITMINVEKALYVIYEWANIHTYFIYLNVTDFWFVLFEFSIYREINKNFIAL